jgi:hypothetical protein
MAFDRTDPFSTGLAGTVTRLNQGVRNTKDIIEGVQAFDRLRLNREDTTVTGTQQNYNIAGLAVSPATAISILRCQGASQVTFGGWTGGENGDVVLVRAGSNPVKFTNEDAGSTAANRFATISTAGLILGSFGTALVWYDGAVSRWRAEVIDPGTPINVAHNNANFSGAGVDADWDVAAGDQVALAYQQAHGCLVRLWWTIAASSVSNTPASLRIALPNSFVGAARRDGACTLIESGASVDAKAVTDSTLAYLSIIKANNAAMANSTNGHATEGFLDLQVQ